MKFMKMHGLGNDFVVLDHRDGQDRLTADQARFLADRKKGIGCDQIITMETVSDSSADLFIHIMNADGSEVGACGNATRCIAWFYMEEHETDHCRIKTSSDILECTRAGKGAVTVDMGLPKTDWKQIPLLQEQDTLHLKIEVGQYTDPVAVNVGNPHCVFFVNDAEKVPLEDLGPKVEYDLSFPERTNVEFVTKLSDDKLRMRVWERGTGVTSACGTGATASFVAARRRGLVGQKVDIVLDGGVLTFEERAEDGHIIMTGPIAHVYDGEVLPKL